MPTEHRIPENLPTDPIEREQALESGVFGRRPLQIVRGEGARVWDAAGKEYLDAAASLGTNHVGHRHPRVVQAIKDQADRLLHLPSTYPNDVRLEFLEKLIGTTPAGLDRAFLCCTGTEAVEAALKFARQATGRTGIVSLTRSFHGRTMGALSATAKRKFQEPFEPLVPDFTHTRAEDVEALKEAVSDKTAALIIEPVQGEGGVLPLSTEFVKAARDITDDHGALLIADEVQTGLGRTGSMWAFEPYGVQPDILTVGKGVGGGLPLAATIITPEVAGGQALASHGSTFAGNPLACAAGVAVIDTILEEGLVARAQEIGEAMMKTLAPLGELDNVREVRGRGAMVGVELKNKPFPVLNAMMERGVLALPAGATVVRLLPPFVTPDDEVDRMSDAVAECVRAELESAKTETA